MTVLALAFLSYIALFATAAGIAIFTVFLIFLWQDRRRPRRGGYISPTARYLARERDRRGERRL